MRKDRQIILFGPWAPPYGGVATHMRDLYENLKMSNFSARVFGYGNFVPKQDIDKIYFSPRYKWLWTLLKIFECTSPGDIIHKHSVLTSYPDRYFLQTFLWLLKVKKFKWVETIHDETLVSRYEDFSHAIKGQFPTYLSKAEKINTIGERLRIFLIDLGISEEKIVVSSPLLPIRFSPSETEIPDYLSAFYNSHSPMITTIGPFHPLYDFKTIVKAFLSLKYDYPQAGLIIINARFARDIKYEKEVKSLIEKSPKDILSLYELERERVLYILNKSNLFLRGTGQESFGLSRIESILMGTPVVSTKAGETRYMVLYEHGNPDDLYEKMKAVLDGKIKIDINEAQAFFKRMADENLRRITDIYRDI